MLRLLQNASVQLAISDTKFYVPLVTLSIQDNIKLLKQIESGFKRIIIWNKYQLKVTTHVQDQYLDYLINPSFQGVNRLFVLSFGNNALRTRKTELFNQPKNKRLQRYDRWLS